LKQTRICMSSGDLQEIENTSNNNLSQLPSFIQSPSFLRDNAQQI